MDVSLFPDLKRATCTQKFALKCTLVTPQSSFEGVPFSGLFCLCLTCTVCNQAQMGAFVPLLFQVQMLRAWLYSFQHQTSSGGSWHNKRMDAFDSWFVCLSFLYKAKLLALPTGGQKKRWECCGEFYSFWRAVRCNSRWYAIGPWEGWNST